MKSNGTTRIESKNILGKLRIMIMGQKGEGSRNLWGKLRALGLRREAWRRSWSMSTLGCAEEDEQG